MTSTTHTTTTQRLLAAVAVAGAIAAAATGIAGNAFAGPHDSHSPNNSGGDNSGWRHIDPYGYHYNETDPREAAAQQDRRREYFNNRPNVEATTNGNNNQTTWSRVQRPDGSWVVCKAQARFC